MLQANWKLNRRGWTNSQKSCERGHQNGKRQKKLCFKISFVKHGIDGPYYISVSALNFEFTMRCPFPLAEGISLNSRKQLQTNLFSPGVKINTTKDLKSEVSRNRLFEWFVRVTNVFKYYSSYGYMHTGGSQWGDGFYG